MNLEKNNLDLIRSNANGLSTGNSQEVLSVVNNDFDVVSTINEKGEKESGWYILEVNGDDVSLNKIVAGEEVKKQIKIKDLLEANEGIDNKKLDLAIINCQTLDEVIENVEKSKGYFGKNSFLGPDILAETVQNIKNGALPADSRFIPDGPILKKIQELLKLEQGVIIDITPKKPRLEIN